MNVLSGLRILSHKLAGLFFKTTLQPSDVMAFTLQEVEKAVRDSQLQLAKLKVARKETAKTLEQLRARTGPDPQLVAVMEEQLAQYDDQIRKLELLIAKMGQEAALLKVRSTGLTVRANLMQTQEHIRGLLGDLGVDSAGEVFDRIEDDLSHREAVHQALDEIKHPPRPELPPGT
ncbi:MAG TPA: hypothetical protein V6D05_10460 [Stenomitos sp.]